MKTESPTAKRMRIYTSAEELSHLGEVVVSIGMFDGVHLAHRQILVRLVEKSRELKASAVVISFQPHPREVLTGQPFPMILTMEEKQELLEMAGVDVWICLPFTKSFSSLSPEEFIRFLQKRMRILHVVLGYNHGFGKGKQGDIRLLSQWGENYRFGVTEVPCLRLGQLEISSSAIRSALLDGEITLANRLLGYPYLVRGTRSTGDGASACPTSEPACPTSEPASAAAVVSGNDRMLEICVREEKLLPRCGCYLGRWNQRKVQVEIKESRKMVLLFQEKAPSVELLVKQPLYFIKQL